MKLAATTRRRVSLLTAGSCPSGAAPPLNVVCPEEVLSCALFDSGPCEPASVEEDSLLMCPPRCLGVAFTATLLHQIRRDVNHSQCFIACSLRIPRRGAPKRIR